MCKSNEKKIKRNRNFFIKQGRIFYTNDNDKHLRNYLMFSVGIYFSSA
jgi:predicted phosphatase